MKLDSVPLNCPVLHVPDDRIHVVHSLPNRPMSQLPPELWEHILNDLADEGARPSLASIARCSQTFNQLATPILYRKIVLTRRNAALLFYGLPRDSPPKKHNITKQQWDEEFKRYKQKFARILEGGAPRRQRGRREPEWSDSEPETDDELATEPDDDGDWERRLTLLAYCKHLSIVQVPTRSVVQDLRLAAHPIGPTRRPGSTAWPWRQIFPNLDYLSCSNRAVRHRGEFFSLVQLSFGQAKHLCLTGVDDDITEYAFRCNHVSVDSLTEFAVNLALTELRGTSYEGYDYGRRSRVAYFVDLLDCTRLESVTVHNLRHIGPVRLQDEILYVLPYLNERSIKYRYFVTSDDTLDDQAAAIAEVLRKTAPITASDIVSFELIDADEMLESEVLSRIADISYATPIKDLPDHRFEPEDYDATLEAEVEVANANAQRLAEEARVALLADELLQARSAVHAAWRLSEESQKKFDRLFWQLRRAPSETLKVECEAAKEEISTRVDHELALNKEYHRLKERLISENPVHVEAEFAAGRAWELQRRACTVRHLNRAQRVLPTLPSPGSRLQFTRSQAAPCAVCACQPNVKSLHDLISVYK